MPKYGYERSYPTYHPSVLRSQSRTCGSYMPTCSAARSRSNISTQEGSRVLVFETPYKVLRSTSLQPELAGSDDEDRNHEARFGGSGVAMTRIIS